MISTCKGWDRLPPSRRHLSHLPLKPWAEVHPLVLLWGSPSACWVKVNGCERVAAVEDAVRCAVAWKLGSLQIMMHICNDKGECDLARLNEWIPVPWSAQSTIQNIDVQFTPWKLSTDVEFRFRLCKPRLFHVWRGKIAPCVFWELKTSVTFVSVWTTHSVSWFFLSLHHCTIRLCPWTLGSKKQQQINVSLRFCSQSTY